MRARRATGHAHLSNYLPARDIVTNLHCLPALVQIGCGHPVAVVQNCQAAFEVEIRPGESDTRRSRRRDRRARPRCNIDAEMRRHRVAVEYPLAAEWTADDAGHGPI